MKKKLTALLTAFLNESISVLLVCVLVFIILDAMYICQRSSIIHFNCGFDINNGFEIKCFIVHNKLSTYLVYI